MNKLLTAAFAAVTLSALCAAEPVNKNGDFEKVKTEGSGVMLPEGWVINKGLSKGYTVTMTQEKEDVRGGTFAMEVETEKEGQLFLMDWMPFEVKQGDTLTFSIYAKGSGSFQIGYLMHGLKNGEKDSTFLWTAASKSLKPSEDAYKQFTWKSKLGKLEKDGKTFDTVNAFPVIIVQKGSNVLFDDFAVEQIKPEPAAK